MYVLVYAWMFVYVLAYVCSMYACLGVCIMYVMVLCYSTAAAQREQQLQQQKCVEARVEYEELKELCYQTRYCTIHRT